MDEITNLYQQNPTSNHCSVSESLIPTFQITDLKSAVKAGRDYKSQPTDRTKKGEFQNEIRPSSISTIIIKLADYFLP
ncbi:hypothetical protein [Pedobacter sp. N23S346]|uniref:hypothetical protein n=1 Tax=Pedobacter sp. N23S346 TaxID=3402750 RepID=UPI003ACCCEB1